MFSSMSSFTAAGAPRGDCSAGSPDRARLGIHAFFKITLYVRRRLHGQHRLGQATGRLAIDAAQKPFNLGMLTLDMENSSSPNPRSTGAA
jgi:hypothetical protein